MSKHISSVKLSDTLTMSLCSDGYWLWDDTRGMNLAMYAKTEQDAFVEALTYYQEHLGVVELEYKTLKSKVNEFVSEFTDEDND